MAGIGSQAGTPAPLAGVYFSAGEASLNAGTGTVQVSSRLFFAGTVAGSASANDLSRLTDAREKGRIGILGSALSYAGSYGRVTSESLGRDLNPLGRGDGGSYVAGGLNLGRIAPRLPKNAAASGTGNSVNNCGQGSPGPAADPMGGGGAGGPGQTPRGTDCECVSCCRGWGVSYSSQLQTGPAPCEAACDYCHAGAGGSCQDQECACRGCLWDYYNSIGEFQPSRYEVMCEKCCCDGCPCSSGSGGGGGAEGTGSGKCGGASRSSGNSPGASLINKPIPPNGVTFTECKETIDSAIYLWNWKERRNKCLCFITDDKLRNCLEEGMNKTQVEQPDYRTNMCLCTSTKNPRGASPDCQCDKCKEDGKGYIECGYTLNGFTTICCNTALECARGAQYRTLADLNWSCNLMDTFYHETIHRGGCSESDIENSQSQLTEFVKCMCKERYVSW